MDVADPAREQGADEGADSRRRLHESEPERAGLEHVEGEHGEQRHRHAEDHRVEVDDERPEDRPALPDEAQTLADGVEAGPRDLAQRG